MKNPVLAAGFAKRRQQFSARVHISPGGEPFFDDS